MSPLFGPRIQGQSVLTHEHASMTMAAPQLCPLRLTLFFLLAVPYSSSSSTTPPPSESDILLSFKSSLPDPSNALSTWSAATALALCSSWAGITCTPGLPTGAVTAISLPSLNLSGDIPSTLCGLPALTHLNLADNNFSSPIPLGLSQCSTLQTLNLSVNLLWGPIPDQISSLAALQVLDLGGNRLEGMIPEGLGSLSALQVLDLRDNLLAGGLNGPGLANLTALVHLDLSGNPLLASGLPPEIGRFKNLRRLLMRGSGSSGGIPESFNGLHALEVLDLSQNNLTGRVPAGFGLGLPELESLDLSENKLSGRFPADVCSGQKLVRLHLHSNSFTGSILATFAAGQCLALEDFQVQNNAFSGAFPPGLWSLPKIAIIRAESNRFTGQLPGGGSAVSAPKLEQVQIDNNGFTGSIPAWLGSARAMYLFSASLNAFSGGLPDGFCGSDAMSIMNLSRNALSGPIPELRRCKKLVALAMAGNRLTGVIPPSITQLPVLTYIDLSDNELTGEIPPGIGNMKLALFNVSFNQLTGRVPSAVVSGLPASYLQGNPGLCGPDLPGSCSEGEAGNAKAARSYRVTRIMCALVTVALSVGVVALAAGLFVKYRRTTSSHSALRGKDRSTTAIPAVFFYPLRITAEDLLSRLNNKNIVGRGALGKTHVVQLLLPGAAAKSVAVKELALAAGGTQQPIRKLKDDIKVLAKARHKNIVNILGFFCCSEESVHVIYECLPNGSLADVMCRPGVCLEWRTRLRIALGVARGLCYLHKSYVPHLLHRNVKSGNVLLDEDFEPKVTDFALDRVVGEPLFLSSVASELGSCCYIAPEQAYVKKPTEAMDVYGFGVLLLELLSGRPASQPDPNDQSLDVVRWVRRKINTAEGAAHILDPRLTQSTASRAEMLAALDLALRCTSVVPEKRPAMPEVGRMLQSPGTQGSPPMDGPHADLSTSSTDRDVRM